MRSSHTWRNWILKISASSLRKLIAVLSIALSVPSLGFAQGFRVTGRVVRGATNDSLPVAGGAVVLHEVTIQSGRPVDSATTNRLGEYRLTAPVRDTAAGYVVSVEHDGIGYFSEPLSARDRAADSASAIVVYDTSYGRPEILLTERHLIVRAIDDDGMRRVIELLVLSNRGNLTRITDDTTQPVWQGALPSKAVQFEVGQSDLSPQTIYRNGAFVAVTAPLPPGDKQVLVAYLIPGSVEQLTIPVDQPVVGMNLMLEDLNATVLAERFEPRGTEELEGISFLRYGATALPAGTTVRIQFPDRPFALTELWWLVVPLAALSLVGVLVWWLRRQPVPVATQADSNGLALQISQLDREFEARAAHASRAEKQAYRQQRAELKARLSDMLAGGNQPS